MLKFKPLIAVLVLLASLFHHGQTTKILALFPIPSKSQTLIASELLAGLAEKGYNVTMVSYFPLKNPPKNYKDIVIDIKRPWQIYEQRFIKPCIFRYKPTNVVIALDKINEVVFEDPKMQELMNSDQQFDAVIYNADRTDSFYGLSYKFNASSILYQLTEVNLLSAMLFGHPYPTAYMPSYISEYSDDMTLFEHLDNWLNNMAGYFYIYFIGDPFIESLISKHFPEAPPLKKLRENIKILLLNNHPTVGTIYPSFQNMISVGGIHLQRKQELSDSLKKYLDHSTNGVIFFSFGSNLKSAHLNMRMINEFLAYFETSSYNVLWNFDINLSNVSNNVKIKNWLPQRAVLGHSNVKLFITHGGKHSLTEAIYHGVPMIVIPFYADQMKNAKFCTSRKIGLSIATKDVSKSTLTEAIDEIKNNPMYMKNIQERSVLFKNQEMDPLEKAIYWIEFAIKYRDTNIFQTPANKLPWYTLLSIDVAIIAFLIVVVMIVIIYYSIKCGILLVKLIRARKVKTD